MLGLLAQHAQHIVDKAMAWRVYDPTSGLVERWVEQNLPTVVFRDAEPPAWVSLSGVPRAPIASSRGGPTLPMVLYLGLPWTCTERAMQASATLWTTRRPWPSAGPFSRTSRRGRSSLQPRDVLEALYAIAVAYRWGPAAAAGLSAAALTS